jgi:hypothetical protein
MMAGTWRKATYSNSFSNCLEARWRKPSRSVANGACFEGRLSDGQVQVRDSKLGGASPVLSFAPAAWQAFLAMVKA